MERRDFIKFISLAPLASSLPLLTSNSIAASNSKMPWHRKLILLELKGGNDGLNTLVPYHDPLYRRYRPTIGLRKDEIITLSESIGLNHKMSGLMSIWEDGQLAITQGVGYKHPNLSHFRSIEIWNSASDSDVYMDSGWLTQLFQTNSPPEQFVSNGIALGYDTGPLAGHSARNIVLNNPKQFFKQAKRVKPTNTRNDNPALKHILNTQNEILHAAQQLQKQFKRVGKLQTLFPKTAIGKQLQLAANLIHASINTAVIKVSLEGFDTHSNQRNKHDRLLLQLSEAVKAFQQAMIEADQWDNVMLMTYSEFGRRPEENGSKGTDHGTSAPHFILGGNIKGGLYGYQPPLGQLRKRNLTYAIDFRQLYATVAHDWWQMDKTKIGLQFESLPFIKNL